MNCPSCSAANAEGAAECAQCGIVFAKWRQRQNEKKLQAMVSEQAAETAAISGIPQAAPAAASSPAGLIKAAVAGMSVLLGGWGFYPGKGLPAAPIAKRDKVHQCAIVPPDGWSLDESKTEPVQGGGQELATFKAPSESGYASRLGVVVFPGGAAKVSDSRIAVLMKAYFPTLQAKVDTWSLEGKKIIEIDRLPALKVTGSGPKQVRETVPPVIMTQAGAYAYMKSKFPHMTTFTLMATTSMNAHGQMVTGYEVEPEQVIDKNLTLAAGGALVSGRTRAFLLYYHCDVSDKARCEKAFDEFKDSFRVLTRPRPWDYLAGAKMVR